MSTTPLAAVLSGPERVVTGDGRMTYQPEGHHGMQWLYLVPLAPEAMRLPKEADAWYPPHIDTTAYSQDPIVNRLVDGRLFIRGADGIYRYDLRAAAGREAGETRPLREK